MTVIPNKLQSTLRDREYSNVVDLKNDAMQRSTITDLKSVCVSDSWSALL